MPTIVLIEDDKLIADPIARALEGRGYKVLKAYDGAEGLRVVLSQAPDLVILDIMLPGMDGWEVCKAIRQQSVVPILMLTALGDEIDRVVGLELGADDYVSKPFSTRELLARIKALLRRVEFDSAQTRPSAPITRFGNVSVEMDKRRVVKGDEELSLRFKEFELLQLLLNHAGEIVSRADIFEQVWGTDWLGDTRTLDVHIRWLREKLEDDASNPRHIQTVRNVGYRLVLDA